jgi:hypothetical protein
MKFVLLVATATLALGVAMDRRGHAGGNVSHRCDEG